MMSDDLYFSRFFTFNCLKHFSRKRKTEPSADEPDGKKAKIEQPPELSKSDKDELKKQMKKIYYYRDMLERHLAKKDLEELLTHNDQEIPSGPDRVRRRGFLQLLLDVSSIFVIIFFLTTDVGSAV